MNKPGTATVSKNESTGPTSRNGHQKRRIRTRAQILEGARNTFLKVGYHATSMDHVAAEAGISKPTLYNYFSSKEQLFKTLMLEKTSEIRQSIQLAVSAERSVKEQLIDYGMRYARQSLDDEAMALSRIVIGLASEMPELSQFYYDLAHQVTTDSTTAFLRGLADVGLLKLRDPELASEQFRALILTSYYGPLTYKPAGRPEEEGLRYSVEQGVDLFLKGYGR